MSTRLCERAGCGELASVLVAELDNVEAPVMALCAGHAFADYQSRDLPTDFQPAWLRWTTTHQHHVGACQELTRS